MTVRLREHWQRTGWPLTMSVTLPFTFQPTLPVLNFFTSAVWVCPSMTTGIALAVLRDAALLDMACTPGRRCGATTGRRDAAAFSGRHDYPAVLRPSNRP